MNNGNIHSKNSSGKVGRKKRQGSVSYIGEKSILRYTNPTRTIDGLFTKLRAELLDIHDGTQYASIAESQNKRDNREFADLMQGEKYSPHKKAKKFFDVAILFEFGLRAGSYIFDSATYNGLNRPRAPYFTDVVLFHDLV